jgi:hypothetical protein
MLKMPASGVLASFRPSTYREGTPRIFTRCGLADGLFEHPARGLSRWEHVQATEISCMSRWCIWDFWRELPGPEGAAIEMDELLARVHPDPTILEL